MNLASLLHQTFGFPAFRANQEAVCRSATEGRDVLLVMPTGAGKSLCYQLPAIARGGTALVISPLIALMDDQASKLTAAGLKVARIHSGLDREQSRQACREYLDGTLQFLFIAPERMRVPGFPEMLAKRKPALIAIDEAHCISAWGHDFRPDYRTLGDYLPSLRPAPIIALTATATPTVQKDIVAQLQLKQPELFIHGFRRDNLHIEVVEMSKPRRNEFAVKLLSQPENRPAIVYAPSRKAADELAGMLGGKAAAYHAGLEASVRERVQRHFQSGKLDVVVATIAFGMGIDKADVRTVVHIALPASVEAYYQEIGRAGRDGLPSRTVLLHSFVDRRIHEGFLERDYPPAADLVRVANLLTNDFEMPDPLCAQLRMSRDIFAKCIEKLAVQGAAQIDMSGNVRRCPSPPKSWQSSYEQQVDFRKSQIDRMAQFAETQQCRMSALVRHFGDVADGLKPCGHCDFCAPEGATAQSFREPDAQEERHLRAILQALASGQPKATGRLFTELALGPDRRLFDSYLDALSRAGLLSISSDTFTNAEGTLIPYKRATLTGEGREHTGTSRLPLQVMLRDMESPASGKGKKSSGALRSGGALKASGKAQREVAAAAYSPDQHELVARLRAWRKAEAAKTGKPSFIIFSDSVLHALVVARPRNIGSLLSVSGIGPEKADRYGAAIVALMTGAEVPGEFGELMAAARTQSAHVARSAEPAGLRNFPEPRQQPDPPVLEARQRHKRMAEDFAPIPVAKDSGGRRSREHDAAAYRRVDFERDLRAFADLQSQQLGKPASKLLSEAAIEEILRTRPRTVVDFEHLQELRQDLGTEFYEALQSTCSYEYVPEKAELKQPHFASLPEQEAYIRQPSIPMVRKRAAETDPAESLTHDQQALDHRLREWRRSESERLGLPQFFVLGSSALRSIVLESPRTLDQLEKIEGLGREKIDKYGTGILEVCST